MNIDIVAAQVAKQNVEDAKARTKDAHRKYEEDSVRVRESTDKFYGSLALFSGGTIALSITYLGYLKSNSAKVVLYPRVLVTAWIVLLVCVVASLFCQLLNSYYVHFARLGIYVSRLVELKETFVEEMDNLNIVNATPEEKRQTRSGMQKKLTPNAKTVRG